MNRIQKIMMALGFAFYGIAALLACSKDDEPMVENKTADIINFSFMPPEITVERGATVTWTNMDNATHTVTANDNSFNSGSLTNGNTYARRFDQAGTFTYRCTVHPRMMGTVIVQ